MKIAYIANSLIPGAAANSVHVMKMCEAFAGQNVETMLLIPNHKGQLRNENEFMYYGIKNKFEIVRVGFTLRLYDLWTSLFAFLAINKIRNKGYIAYTRSPIAARLLAMSDMKFIFEYHGIEFPKWYSEKKIFCAANLKKVVVITNSLKKYYMEKYGIKEDKIIVLPDAVNLTEYEKEAKALFSEKRLKIAYVGGLYQGRGVDVVIEMAQKDPDNDYLIVGGRKGEVEFWKKQINGTIKNLTMIGQVPNAEVPDILLKQDILLMPHQKKVSMNGKEDIANWTSPMKMFEYMASGRVILSSNLPVLQEVLQDRKNAYLLNPDSVSEWVDMIKYISCHQEEAIAIAKQAQKDVKAYTWEKRAEKIIEAINAE